MMKNLVLKIKVAVLWLPQYSWERVKLNFAIYFGRGSLKATILRHNRRIEEVMYVHYRMATAHLPYNERELGFNTVRDMEFVRIVSKRLLGLANPSRWRTRRLEGTAWFARQVKLYERDRDWADRVYRRIWRIISGAIKLAENLLDVPLAGGWFLYTRFLRHPRNSKLAALRNQLQALVISQEELIREFERIISPAGEETPIETSTRQLREQEKETRRIAEETDRRQRFLTARDNLSHAFEGLGEEQARNPIETGTPLSFAAVETYVREALEEAESLLGEGKPAPGEDYITALDLATEDVRHGFRFWAESVAKDRRFYDEVLEAFRNIEEDFEEFNPSPQIVKISDLFRKSVPILWGDARWVDLKSQLTDVREMTNQLAEAARDFRNWGVKVKAIQQRVDETEELRQQIRDQYGEEVSPSQEWVAAWNTFVEEATPAFAIADWTILDWALQRIEDPLRKNEYKVRSALERLSQIAVGSSGLKKSEDVTRGSGTKHARSRFLKGGNGKGQEELRSISVGGRLKPADLD